MKNTIRIGAVVAVSALALAACSSAPEDETSSTATAAATTAPVESIDFVPCMVSDAGGFDDKSFNQSGFDGLVAVSDELGMEYKTAESTDGNEYTANIDAMVDGGCDLIITVGFLLSQATVDAALANPDTNFAIIDDLADNDYDGTTDAPNIKPITFSTDEAAFLAGYGAAAATQTGTVATFGGINIPSVTIFMQGFLNGVNYFNTQTGGDVNVLGWDGTDGSFTGDFDDQTKGQDVAKGFISQGADIIMPVAGPVGLGAAAAAKDAGNTWIVGVDTDWTVTAPEYSDIILTSVIKQIGAAVEDVVSGDAVGDGFDPAAYLGTLANDGVGISDFAEGTVDADVVSTIDDLKAQIIDGSLAVK